MASFKPRYKDGTLYIQIIHNRKSKLVKLQRLPVEFWDTKKLLVKKKYPNSIKLNLLISTMINDMMGRELDFKTQRLEYSMNDLVHGAKTQSLLGSIDEYLSYLKKDNKFKAYRKVKNIRDHVAKFRDVSVKSMNRKYILDLIQSIDVSKNTIAKYMSSIKTAMRYSGNLPHWFSIMKFDRSEVLKVYLTKEEFLELENVKLKGIMDLHRDCHLMQYYTFGTRISDVLSLTEENIKSDTLEFIEMKTKKRKVVPRSKKINKLIVKYQRMSKFILPMRKHEGKDGQLIQKDIESKTAQINKSLKVIAAKCDIDKNLSSHVARYSVTTWLEEMQVPATLRKQLLNHSTERMNESYSLAEKNVEAMKNIELF